MLRKSDPNLKRREYARTSLDDLVPKDHLLRKTERRQDYLVTQANDLARSFGNLKTFEHKSVRLLF